MKWLLLCYHNKFLFGNITDSHRVNLDSLDDFYPRNTLERIERKACWHAYAMRMRIQKDSIEAKIILFKLIFVRFWCQRHVLHFASISPLFIWLNNMIIIPRVVFVCSTQIIYSSLLNYAAERLNYAVFLFLFNCSKMSFLLSLLRLIFNKRWQKQSWLL